MTDSNNPAGGRVSPRAKHIFIAALVAVVGLVFAWLVLTGKPKPEPKPPTDVLRPAVSVIEVRPAAMALSVHTQGTIEPRTRINLVAQVGGKVESVANHFVDGAFFQAGDILLNIESDDYQFAIARAKSAVAAAEQRLAEERGRNRQAKREWRDLGTDEANALFLREPQMRAAEAALEAARADQAAAELALERTRIRAPFDGRIEVRRADLGQFVTAGSPVAEIYATDVMQVRLPLTDSQLAALSLPLYSTAEVSRPVILESRFGGDDWQWQAQLRRVEAVVDRQSRALHAIAEVDQPFSAGQSGKPPLTPGMFVHANIPTPAIEGLVKLPAVALRSDDSILVVDSDSRLERRVVEVRRRTQEWAWISGVPAGTRVVREQTGLLVSGLAVEVVSSTDMAGVN